MPGDMAELSPPLNTIRLLSANNKLCTPVIAQQHRQHNEQSCNVCLTFCPLLVIWN